MVRLTRRFFVHSVLAFASLTGAVAGHAEESYPSRPVELVLGYAAGGSADFVARAYAERLSKELGQSVVVINQGGASGAIAGERVSRAAPDGHTLNFVASPTMTLTPLVTKVPFDPIKDFQPVAPVVGYAQVLLVSAQSPFESLADLVNHAKKHPGELIFGSSGVGSLSFMAGKFLESKASIELTHVPYKGNGPALADVIGGHIAFLFDLPTTAIAQIKGGRVRALAVTSSSRNPMLPDVPTMKESGYPDFELTAWLGVLGPAKLPEKVLTKLVRASDRVTQEPTFRALMKESGYELFSESPEELRQRIAREHQVFERLFK